MRRRALPTNQGPESQIIFLSSTLSETKTKNPELEDIYSYHQSIRIAMNKKSTCGDQTTVTKMH